MQKDLKYFMREPKEEIITVPGPETIKDKDGNVINLEIKVLGQKAIQGINEMYRTKEVMRDQRGVPIANPANNEAIFKVEKDGARAVRHIIAEALVYPNLKDEKLMEFYKCHDITEMALHVFHGSGEYAHVVNAVMSTQVADDEPSEQNVEDAKN